MTSTIESGEMNIIECLVNIREAVLMECAMALLIARNGGTCLIRQFWAAASQQW